MWCKPLEGSDGIPSDHTEDDWSRGSAEDPDTEVDGDHSIPAAPSPLNELDRKVRLGQKVLLITHVFPKYTINFFFKVQQTAKIVQKHCHCDKDKCSKLSVKKVGDGKYNIAGRNVFVRVSLNKYLIVNIKCSKQKWTCNSFYFLCKL